MNGEYRGKRVDGKGWAYGYYVKGECSYIISAEQFYSAVVLPTSLVGNHMSTFCHEVHLDSIGQWTGLKDKNDKKIYESDILLIKYKDGNSDTAPIWYNDQAARFVFTDKEGGSYGIIVSDGNDIEIIGSIHDTPNLLETK